MGVVWYAIGLYIVGISVVLYIRPSSMFRPGGTWKEFGLSNQGSYTVFPFWMFALVWAIVSYAAANMFSIFLSSTVLKSSIPNMHEAVSTPSVTPAAAPAATNIIQPISATPAAVPASVPVNAPTIPAATLAQPMEPGGRFPGYYILDNMMRPDPRYIYWGPEPPSASNVYGVRTATP